MKEVYDLIIVGSGPAGLSAAVYAARYKLKTLVIGQIPGGMAAEAYEICNLISYQKIRGFDLSIKMKTHVEMLGIEIVPAMVTSIEKKDLFEVNTQKKKYFSKKLLLAMGSKKRKLNIKDENKFLGKGISYCATCDAAFFRDKIVTVIGGSDVALTAALLLSEFAKKVYLSYRQKEFFRAEPTWIDAVKNNDKIEVIFNSNVVELIGENFLEKIKLDTGRFLDSNGLFIEIGSFPNSKIASNLGIKTENGFIVVNKEQKTNIKGIFAAGDITNNNLKQIITAAAEGAVAATQAYHEIKGEEK
jgi:thioredoxin reductase (NADPH)